MTIDKNYRPVSNLAFISKLIEKAVLYKLNEHCTCNDIHSAFQSAYKENNSCETALLKVVNDMLWTMECTQVKALFALDLSAAFGTVDHVMLLKVMDNKVGITDDVLE